LLRANVQADGKIEQVLMFVNGGHDALRFSFPSKNVQWYLLIDSAAEKSTTQAVQGPDIQVQGHSVMLFANRVPKELQDQ
jgi:isoamylase